MRALGGCACGQVPAPQAQLPRPLPLRTQLPQAALAQGGLRGHPAGHGAELATSSPTDTRAGQRGPTRGQDRGRLGSSRQGQQLLGLGAGVISSGALALGPGAAWAAPPSPPLDGLVPPPPPGPLSPGLLLGEAPGETLEQAWTAAGAGLGQAWGSAEQGLGQALSAAEGLLALAPGPLSLPTIALPALSLPALALPPALLALSLPSALALPPFVLAVPTNGQLVGAVSGAVSLALSPLLGAWASIQLSPDAPLESLLFYLGLTVLFLGLAMQPRE